MSSEPLQQKALRDTLVFKTRDDARVTPEPVSVTPTPEGYFDQSGVPPTPRDKAEPWQNWVEDRLAWDQGAHVEAIGQVLAHERQGMRDTVNREVGRVKRELDLLRREAASLRDEVERERALSAKAADIERTQREMEYDLLRRELAVLRNEVGVKRGLQALHEEIATARAEIPKVSAIEARIDAKQAKFAAEQVRLQKELEQTQNRVSKMRVDQSIINYGLGELRKEAAAAKAAESSSVQMEFETSTTHFTMRNVHPSAARALREFASQIVDAKDGGAVWLSLPQQGAQN